MIRLIDYWMGRDVKYAKYMRPEFEKNASIWCARVNKLITIFTEEAGIVRDKLSSGWRPPVVNDATSNAAKKSTHLTAEGGDIKDDDRALAAWCVSHPEALAECGLYMEDPRWTPTWVHLQTRPPGSGKRIYVPSTAKAKAPALPGQNGLPLVVKI